MEKMNRSPLLNPIQMTAQIMAALKALPGENIVAVVTKTVYEDRPGFPTYDVYACKGGVVNGHLVES